jgi:hypothetical protein
VPLPVRCAEVSRSGHPQRVSRLTPASDRRQRGGEPNGTPRAGKRDVKTLRSALCLMCAHWFTFGCGMSPGNSPDQAGDSSAEARSTRQDAGADGPTGQDANPGGADTGLSTEGGANPEGWDAGPLSTEDVGPGQTACGGATCNASSEVCCLQEGALACVPGNECSGIPLRCSGGESCLDGDTCCTTTRGFQFNTGTVCTSSCAGGVVCTSSSECHPPYTGPTTGPHCVPYGGFGYGFCL